MAKPFYSITDCTNKSKNDMKRTRHISIQNHGGVSISPVGVILSALAECEGLDMTLYEKAIHIDNALALIIEEGSEIKFYNNDDAMLIFEPVK